METKVLPSGTRYSFHPENYVRPEFARPRLSELTFCNDVPVIDLGCGERELMVKQIAQACSEYGFFQVINHGVPKKVIEDMLKVAEEFFQLPVEEKMKLYTDYPSKTMRLSTSFNVKKLTVHNWRDYLRLPCLPSGKYSPEWPSNPSSFRDIVSNYVKEVRELGFRVEEAISESLGLEKSSIREVLGEQGQHLRLAEPELTYGLPAHTDPNALTILLQDTQVSGLQVLKDGKWLAVKPHPDAFVINLGDQLQALRRNNGKYKSVCYSAIVNKHGARMLNISFKMEEPIPNLQETEFNVTATPQQRPTNYPPPPASDHTPPPHGRSRFWGKVVKIAIRLTVGFISNVLSDELADDLDI
ncbi:protein DOWNY MILDEW RESISTANCE 6-like [Ipomoea triloba]|uniref:protein DOWNY MILDEW RESISTANCE 6-like n=1 Tax=Ipomoea triloba TaxID=35885 RepID=UPI00125E6C96|nr:protein DOWNY MILDEW RESISTANCE 6-like [Ipomoea triloba]